LGEKYDSGAKMKNKTYSAIMTTLFQITILPQKTNWAEANIADVATIIKRIINLILMLAGGLGVVFLVWGALQYLTAYGNEEKAQKGKNYILWTIVGLVLIALFEVILNTFWQVIAGRSIPKEIEP
jgi:hypothetical protein